MALTVYILGSGQDGGLPQFGSRMAADMAARVDPLAVRLGPSICVLDDDGRCFLVDVSPDIKEQENRLLTIPAYARGKTAGGAPATPAGVGAHTTGNPFDGVLLTHAHMGHYAGLVHFGREAANCRGQPVYCTEQMASFLAANAPWEQLVKLGNIELRPVGTRGSVSLQAWPGLNIRAIPVPHRGEYTDTVGVSINEKLLYVPDIDNWDAWPAAREEVAKHQVCLLDATFYSRDELPGRDLREISHPFITDTLAKFADLAQGRRIILTHFNHSNPVCDPASKEARSVQAAGFELAQEMLAIEL
ncbi:MAG: Coenzyme PQQ synthesis protein B [Planctomycetes bacterium]|nr:Coenzyme PQQ synthesis protein B [Planctomycetota bacterium]